MSRIAFITYAQQPNLTPADAAVLQLLTAQGHTTQAAVWNDPTVNWSSFDSIVIRSTWDYHTQPEDFQRWLTLLEEQNAPLWNPAPLIRWNMNKYYLRELAAQGVPTPKTQWISQEQSLPLAEIFPSDWEKAVLKPVVSASAHNTHLLTAAEAVEFQPEFQALLAQGDLMLQPFMPQIQSEGEWSLIFFNKAYSHAVLKRPRDGDFRVQAEHGGAEHSAQPPHALIEQAEAILALIEHSPLYARVDGLNVDGVFTLMELELIEKLFK